jgi:hypothetical protein
MTEEHDTGAALALKLMGYKVRNFGGTMKVETYEIEEPKAEPQIEAEAIQLIEKMGLSGQRSLVVDTGTAEKRLPYREASKSERVIFEAIFPKCENVETYALGVIPVRALQVLAHGKELFDKVNVRYSESGSETMIVGVNGPSYSEKWFPLARWGGSLRTSENFRAEAREIIKADFQKKLKECAEKCKVMLSTLDDLVESRLSGETISLPTAY